jgi:hypothetical protein
MKDTVSALNDAGLDVQIMIGGGQIDQQIRQYTGTDAYGRDARAAVLLTKEWGKEYACSLGPIIGMNCLTLNGERSVWIIGRTSRQSSSTRKPRRITESASNACAKSTIWSHMIAL